MVIKLLYFCEIFFCENKIFENDLKFENLFGRESFRSNINRDRGRIG